MNFARCSLTLRNFAKFLLSFVLRNFITIVEGGCLLVSFVPTRLCVCLLVSCVPTPGQTQSIYPNHWPDIGPLIALIVFHRHVIILEHSNQWGTVKLSKLISICDVYCMYSIYWIKENKFADSCWLQIVKDKYGLAIMDDVIYPKTNYMKSKVVDCIDFVTMTKK
jgi:hypothetical protein